MGSRGVNGNLYIGRLDGSNAFGANSGWINFGEGATDTDNFIAFGTLKSGISGGERVRIDELGNVGIGTTAPNKLLEVNITAPSNGISTNGTVYTPVINTTDAQRNITISSGGGSVIIRLG